jgi:hypothetical protein
VVTRLTADVCEAPLKVAVTLTFWFELKAPALAEKVADAEPAATVTEAGTLSAALLLDRLTVDPPVGAAAFRVTVQVLEPPEAKLVGVQEIPVSTGMPVPLMLIASEAPVDELLASISWPLAAPAAVGSN